MIEKIVKIDLNGKKKPFKHFFRATGYANADYTYTAPVRKMYDFESSYYGHPKYMRLHNIMTLHGKGDYYKFQEGLDYGNPSDRKPLLVDVVVQRNSDGNFVYNWDLVDTVYDIIISHEMKPIVEMVYLPSVLARPNGDICIPNNFKEYYEVVRAFVLHFKDRYGDEEVKKWYFEVVNEPENYDIVNEKPETFMALYDYFEAAVHSVNPEYKAGGPAVKQWQDGIDVFSLFLKHCSKGVNYASGTFGTRIDFISVHCKAGNPSLVGPQMEYMFDSLRTYANIIKKYPQYVDLPFFNDESDIVWDGNRGIDYKSWLNFRNTEYAPGFMCKMINTYSDVIEDELGLNLEIVDSDNSHLPWEIYTFSGNRSQLTPLGKAPCSDLIRKPMFNFGQLVGRLGGQRYLLDKSDSEFGVKYGALATEYDNSEGYAFMLWNFEDGLSDDVNERKISLKLNNLPDEAPYDCISYAIDENHSNAYSIFKRMGKPSSLTEEQIKELRENECLELLSNPTVVTGSSMDFSYEMKMHSVVLLLLVKQGGKPEDSSAKPEYIEELSVLGKKQIFLKWRYSSRKDFIGYNIYRNGEKLNKKLFSGACYTDSACFDGIREYQIEYVYASSESKFTESLIIE